MAITTGAETLASFATTASTCAVPDPIVAEPGIVSTTLLQLTVSCKGNITITTPTGWTLQAGPVTSGTAAAGNVREAVYTRFGNPGAFTVTFSTSSGGNVSVLPIFGVNNTTPLDATPTTVVDGTADTNRDGPSITSVTPGALLVECWASDAGASGTITPPVGMTTELQAVVGVRPHAVASEIRSTAGVTGTRNATGTASELSVGIAMAYRPAATAVISDDFTGTNGAAWNASKWNLRGTPDIQSNTGRMLVTSGNYVSQAAKSVMVDYADLEMLVKFVRPTTSEYYVSHWLRGSSWDLAVRPEPANGYALDISSFGLRLLKRVAGTQSDLTGYLAAPTGTMWVRFQVEGSSIRGRVWADGSTEPGAWDLDVVDTSVTGVGRAGLNLYGGSPAATVDARWDDLSVQNLGGWRFALGASGLSSSTGAAGLKARRSLTATGPATTSGTASLRARRLLDASGASTTSGSAALIPPGLSATGTAISLGNAALRATRLLAGSGLALTSGAAVIGVPRVFSAAGLTQSTGAVLLIVRRPLGATGVSATSGSVSFGAGVAIPLFEVPYVESLVPSGPGSLLSPVAGTEIRVSLGVVHPEGDLEVTELGVFGLEDVASADSGGGLTLDIVGMDRSARVRRDRFREPYIVTGGTNAVDAMIALVRRSLPQTSFRFQPTEHTLPNLSWEFGDDPLEALVQMRDSIGYETFFAGDGAYVLRSSAIVVDDPVWQFIEGPGTMVETISRGLSREGVYNGVVQRGENRSTDLDPVQAEAWDTDPTSPTYFDPAFPERSSFGAVPLFHVCADADTEILSRSGWKSHADLAEGDDVLTLDTETGLSVWQPVERVNRFAVSDEPMVSMEGRLHSSLTTGAHRWPVERLNTRTNTWNPTWVTSAELVTTMRLRCAAPCANLPTTPKWSDAFVELVAWYWTEGTDMKWPGAKRLDKRTGGVVVYQSHRKHPEYVARIRAALVAEFGPPSTMAPEDTQAKWREVKHDTGPCAGMTNFRLNRHAGRLLQEVAPAKCVLPEFVGSLTSSQLHLFMNTSVDGDGSRADRGTTLIQQGREQLEPLQMAAVLLGYRPHLFPSPQKARHVSPEHQAKGFTGRASSDMWRLNFSQKQNMHLSSLFRHGSVRTLLYTGVVWCPTTANGTWLARRKGTTYFTGNSEFLTTQVQAQDAADARVRNLRGLSEQVAITARPVPGLEGGDVVHISRGRINVDHAHIIERISLPLRAGMMSVRTRERRL